MNEAIINGISNKLFDVYGVQTANSDLQDDQGFINPFQRDASGIQGRVAKKEGNNLDNDLAHYDHRTISEEDSYEIYVENVAQYLKRPCFLINLITSDLNMKLKPRYSFGSLFDVMYFSNQKNSYKDCLNKGCELFDALEYITIKADTADSPKERATPSSFATRQAMRLGASHREGALAHNLLIRGTKMNFDILDNILHFRVSYNLILENKSDIIDMMEEQQNNIGVINKWD